MAATADLLRNSAANAMSTNVNRNRVVKEITSGTASCSRVLSDNGRGLGKRAALYNMVRSTGAMSCIRAATKEKTDTKPKTRLSPPWSVVVHDDPVTLMSYVTRVFMQVFGYPQHKAQRLMLDVHTTGRSVVFDAPP